MSELGRIKAQLAAQTRHHPQKDHSALKRDLKAAVLTDYVKKILSEAPPLTDEQRIALAELLAPIRKGGAA